MIDLDAIPDELQDRDQWLMWDSSADTPRRPHWKGDIMISWSDPDDWHSFEEAVETAKKRDSWGIGYVMALDNDDHARGLYGCLDLDGVIAEGGGPKEWLPSLEDFLKDHAYAEYSASGEGIHIPLVGQQAPEWWSDSHFSADEHEGVEYLTNKFVAFTGDAMEGCAGADVADTNPAPFLFDAYKELNGESPSFDSDDSGYSDKDRDDLTQEQVEEALEHVDSDCEYPKWRNIAWAVHDWDSGPTGKSLFEDWSRGSSGWDDQSQRLIESIWDRSSQGSGYTVGTLIHHATEAGWSPGRPQHEFDVVADEGGSSDADGGETAVSKTDDGTAAETNDTTQPTTPDTFEQFKDQVRSAIAEVKDDDEMTQRTARHRIATAFIDHYHFVYPEQEVRGWRNVLYVYDADEGVYEARGHAFVQKYLERAAGDYVTNQVVNEVVGKIERMSVERGRHFEASAERLVVENGILDLHTGELHALSPAEYHRQKIAVAWNPDAGEPDAVDDFLHDIVKPSDVPTLYRLIAHTLYKEYIGEKAAILIGGGQNGKSVFLDVIERFIGDWNVTHRELQDFDDDGFAANNLEGKLANLATEIGEQTLNDTTTFKKLTGRDTLDARVKFEKPIKFENFASLMFATNEMPVFGQDNHAIWRRWVYVDFPYTFDDEDPNAKDPVPKQQLMDELTQESQFEALLVRCQQEIQRWHENGGQFFADAMPAEEVREKMKKAAEPIYNFATTCLKPADGDDGFVEKSRVRACYRAYADEEDLPVVAENTFGEQLLSIRDLTIETAQKRVDNQRKRVYNGVELSNRGRQVLGVDEPDDDQQTQVDGVEQAAEIVMVELRTMVEQNDNQPVPREGLVWRSTGPIGKATASRAVDHLAKKGRIMDSSDGILPTE